MIYDNLAMFDNGLIIFSHVQKWFNTGLYQYGFDLINDAEQCFIVVESHVISCDLAMVDDGLRTLGNAL